MKFIRLFAPIMLLVGLCGGGLFSNLSAADTKSFVGIEGNWEVEFRSSAGVIRAQLSVYPARITPEGVKADWQCEGLIWRAGGWEAIQAKVTAASDNGLALERMGYYRYTGEFQTVQVAPVSYDELKGSMVNTDGEPGSVVFRRVYPKIEKVIISPSAVNQSWPYTGNARYHVAKLPGEVPSAEYIYHPGNWSEEYNYMRGARPTLVMNIYGENLWGCWRSGIKDMPAFETHIGGRYVDTYLRNLHQNDDGKQPLIGRRLTVHLWKDLKPGRFPFKINDVVVPLDIILIGHPDSRSHRIGEIKVNSAISDIQWKLDYQESEQRKQFDYLREQLATADARIEKAEAAGRTAIEKEKVILAPFYAAVDVAGQTGPDGQINQSAYDDAVDALFVEKNQSVLRLRHFEYELQVLAESRHELLKKMDAASDELGKRIDAANTARAGGNPILEQISTGHAIIKLDYDFEQIREVERAIKLAANAVENYNYEREKARRTMIDAVDAADSHANRQALATYASYLSQASVDALVQLNDVRKAALVGGPPAALMEAAHKIASNSIGLAVNGMPNYHDGDPGSAVWNPLGKKSGSELAWEEGTRLRDKFYKVYKDKPATTAGIFSLMYLIDDSKSGLKVDFANIKLDKLAKTRSLSDLLSADYDRQLTRVADARKAWSDRSLQNGFKAFGVSYVKKAGEAYVKDAGLNLLKKELAQFFQSGPMRGYIQAQADVAESVRAFRQISDFYWPMLELHKKLIQKRALMVKDLELRPEARMVIQNNDEFVVTAGYRISLFYLGRKTNDQVNAKVTLAGQPLAPGRLPNTYVVGTEFAEYLGLKESPVDLPIIVTIE